MRFENLTFCIFECSLIDKYMTIIWSLRLVLSLLPLDFSLCSFPVTQVLLTSLPVICMNNANNKNGTNSKIDTTHHVCLHVSLDHLLQRNSRYIHSVHTQTQQLPCLLVYCAVVCACCNTRLTFPSPQPWATVFQKTIVLPFEHC